MSIGQGERPLDDQSRPWGVLWHPRANRNRPVAVRSAVTPGTASTGHLSRDVHGTSRQVCASANQSAALVRPVTHYGQIVGRPWAVQNRKLTFPYTSRCRGLSQSEHGLSMIDRDTLGQEFGCPRPSETGYWPRWFAVSANQSASRYCSEPEFDLPEDITGLRSCWVLQSVFLNDTSGCTSFWRCE